MRLIIKDNLKKIVADEGKKIRSINDVYKETYIDEEGYEVEEHFPYYSKIIYVPNSFTENQMNELYIEEEE